MKIELPPLDDPRQQAIPLRPGSADPLEHWLAKSIAAEAAGDYDLCLDTLEKALDECPIHPRLRLHAQFVNLTLRDYRRAYAHWDVWRHFEPVVPVVKGARLWQGILGNKPQQGGALVIQSNEGLGDCVMFARFLPELVNYFDSVSIITPPALETLFRRSFPTVAVCSAPPNADWWCPVTWLMQVLNLTMESFKSPPYLAAAPDTTPRDKRKIGCCWSGNPGHMFNHIRSVMPHDFIKMLEPFKGDAEFINLVPTTRQGWHSPLPEWMGKNDAEDFATTADLMSSCDLIITVDTSVAHVAGALGVPVWTLIYRPPDWRWGIEGTTTPLYDSMTLYRQDVHGEWAPVLAKIGKDLQEFLLPVLMES